MDCGALTGEPPWQPEWLVGWMWNDYAQLVIKKNFDRLVAFDLFEFVLPTLYKYLAAVSVRAGLLCTTTTTTTTTTQLSELRLPRTGL